MEEGGEATVEGGERVDICKVSLDEPYKNIQDVQDIHGFA